MPLKVADFLDHLNAIGTSRHNLKDSKKIERFLQKEKIDGRSKEKFFRITQIFGEIK